LPVPLRRLQTCVVIRIPRWHHIIGYIHTGSCNEGIHSLLCTQQLVTAKQMLDCHMKRVVFKIHRLLTLCRLNAKVIFCPVLCDIKKCTAWSDRSQSETRLSQYHLVQHHPHTDWPSIKLGPLS